MPIRSLPVSFWERVVKDRHPVLNHVVLAKTDIQIHVDIGIDGFQREGYAGGVLRSLQPERVVPGEERRGVNRPQAEVGRLSGRERAAAYRCLILSVKFHFRRERAVGDDARSQRLLPIRSRFRLEAAGRSEG